MSLFTSIDARIFDLDDERIDLLKKDEELFLRVMRNDDPFELINGGLIFLTEEDIQKRKESWANHVRHQIEMVGGIDKKVFIDNADKIIEVFPELTGELNSTKIEVSKASCTSCELNSKVTPIIVKMFSLNSTGRDIEKLSFLGQNAIKKFKKEPLDIDVSKLQMPQQVNKKTIPFKKNSIQEKSFELNVSQIKKDLKIKETTDRKQIIELLLLAANVELAAEHTAEVAAINADTMTESEMLLTGEACKSMREVRRGVLTRAAEIVPQVTGWWCVAKHLPVAETQLYEMFTQTGDKFYVECAKKLKIALDDLLSIDSSVNFKNCPRCEEDRNV